MPEARPNGALPVDEGDLLSLVESVPLAADRERAVVRALEADPALRRRIDAMRRDRDVLASMGAERAPDGLADAVASAVEPVLERWMLLGLEERAAGAVPHDTRLRVSARPSFFSSRGGRRLALAAGLALVAGSVALLVSRSLMPLPAAPPVRVADGGRPADLEARTTSGSAEPVAPGGVAVENPERIASRPAGDSPDAVEQEREPLVAPVIASAVPKESTPDAGNTIADAVRLAAERRLIVVAEVRDPVSAADRLARASPRPGSPAGWRVASEAPAAIASALSRAREVSIVAPVPRPLLPIDTTMAADLLGTPIDRPLIPPRSTGPALDVPPAGEVLYVVETRADAAALEGLRSTLAGDRGATVRFEALADPLPATRPVLVPEAVFWWSRPPAAWSRWSVVPVLVRSAP